MKNSFKRCFVIVNSKSTSSQQAIDQLPILTDFFLPKDLSRLTLRREDFEDSGRLQKVLQRYGADDLVVIIGGDGTINQVMNALLSGSIQPEMQPTVLPLKGGNASDIAHMLHGSAALDLRAIVKHGTRRKAYALSLRQNDKPVQFVLAYASFGASAHVMETVDGLGRRLPILTKARWLHRVLEAGLSLYGLATAGRFTATLHNKTTDYYDILFVNGSRVAKYYRTRARLTDGDFMRLVIRHKHPLLFWHLLRLFQHHQRNKTTQATHTIYFADAVPAQIDGEVYQLAASTTVTIAKAVQTYYVLSAR